MGKGDPSIYPKVATALLGIAFILHLIAIGAPWWATAPMDQRTEHIGLWKYCTLPEGGGESCNDFVDIIYGDWLKAAQAFWIFGLLAVPAAAGIVAMVAFVPAYSDNMTVLGAAMGITGFAGLMNLVSICAFGDRYQEYFNNKEPENWAGQNVGVLDWAFGLAAADTVLCFMALGLLIGSLVESDRH
jgi:ubiquitin carboxyl-terminal hydrolase 34